MSTEEMSDAELETLSAYVDTFTQGYAEAMIWANTYGHESGNAEGEPRAVETYWWQSPSARWAVDAFDSASIAQLEQDCNDFVESNWTDLKGLDPAQCGHDFALTRNHHGAGFWDRGYGELGERLTKAAHVYGESSAWCDISEDASDTSIHIEGAS